MVGSPNPIVDYKYRLIYYGTTLVIKGIYDIKSYDDNAVMIKCGNDFITVSGEKIEINSLDADEIHLSGKISDIMFS